MLLVIKDSLKYIECNEGGICLKRQPIRALSMLPGITTMKPSTSDPKSMRFMALFVVA